MVGVCHPVACREPDDPELWVYTPSQRVFGKNPDIPGDLLHEPSNIVANTASLQDEAIARAQAARASARSAVLSLQDDKVLRRALLARPRRDRPFSSGDVVAYWRDQKWAQGVLSQGTQWYGSGVVMGLIARNVIIAHRRNSLDVLQSRSVWPRQRRRRWLRQRQQNS